MHELIDAAAAQDAQRIDAVLGPGSDDVLSSGDPVADRADIDHVKEMLAEQLEFDEGDDGALIALLGKDGWSFPIPLVPSGKEWCFDADAGRVEIMNRRIGRNEISTLATLHEYVDAQREYASESRDQKPPQFAQRILSQPGKHDGLCWETKEGEPESPLGPLVAEASNQGYVVGAEPGNPYHGYMYRVLRSQGSHAPGGAKNYIDASGNMTGGFAAIAWPAKYANSGVMTFIVNERGIVYQKDLGADTEKAAAAIDQFDPDASWTTTSD